MIKICLTDIVIFLFMINICFCVFETNGVRLEKISNCLSHQNIHMNILIKRMTVVLS